MNSYPPVKNNSSFYLKYKFHYTPWRITEQSVLLLLFKAIENTM